jgi:AraC-like DNA-binding protein
LKYRILLIYMDNIAKKSDEWGLFSESSFSRRAGLGIVSLGKIFDKTEYYCRDRVRDDYLLLLTLDGKAWVKEGARKRSLQRDSWFLLRPGITHSYRDDAVPWSLAYVHFKGPLADAAFDEMMFFRRENLGFRQSSGQARELLLRLISFRDDISLSGEFERLGVLIELLAALHKNHRKNLKSADPVGEAHEYILKNFWRDIPLDDLAELAGLSRFHFARLFHERHGCPPLEFTVRLRIERAKELLRGSPGVKIREIAGAAGFKDPLYFSRVFKARTGMPPEKFRAFAARAPLP